MDEKKHEAPVAFAPPHVLRLAPSEELILEPLVVVVPTHRGRKRLLDEKEHPAPPPPRRKRKAIGAAAPVDVYKLAHDLGMPVERLRKDLVNAIPADVTRRFFENVRPPVARGACMLYTAKQPRLRMGNGGQRVSAIHLAYRLFHSDAHVRCEDEGGVVGAIDGILTHACSNGVKGTRHVCVNPVHLYVHDGSRKARRAGPPPEVREAARLAANIELAYLTDKRSAFTNYDALMADMEYAPQDRAEGDEDDTVLVVRDCPTDDLERYAVAADPAVTARWAAAAAAARRN